MARLLTPPVTVVQGDDAPDIVITLQQDASGTPYILANREAFVVLVDRANPDEYVAKWSATVEDENAGKVRISWIDDPITYSSYLDDLTPGKRYELQIFLARTDLPPRYLMIDAYYGYFNGQFNNTGETQQGSPVFKSTTEEVFLSRSLYDGNGEPDEYVWLQTSLRAATWDEVKNQTDYPQPEKLTVYPIWGYRQIHDAATAPNFVHQPDLNIQFEPKTPEILTPDGSFPPLWDYIIDTVGDVPTLGTYRYETPQPPLGVTLFNIDNENRTDPSKRMMSLINLGLGGTKWYVYDPNNTDFPSYLNEDTGDTPPPTLWEQEEGELPVPEPAQTTDLLQRYIATSAYGGEDGESLGTQTVLTQIPLIVKPSYRLAEAAS
jgi:hypothetical protein